MQVETIYEKWVPIPHSGGDKEAQAFLDEIKDIVLGAVRAVEDQVKAGSSVKGRSADRWLSRRRHNGCGVRRRRTMPLDKTLSDHAIALATLLASRSETGRPGDPRLDFATAVAASQLAPADVTSAAAELEGAKLVVVSHAVGEGAYVFRSVRGWNCAAGASGRWTFAR